jgi:glucosamine--fructose-6-phosphate aminotransferase (isomerizing)
MKSINPRFITTIARGSSDHAAAYLKYAIELTANIPVASIGPSIASIYNASLKMDDSVSLAISQSGQGPDTIQMAKSTATGGALSIAITNDANSALADACNHAIDIQADTEQSIAATKTFVTSIVAGLLLLAHWQDDDALLDALHKLPAQAKRAIECNWPVLAERLNQENSLFVLGRGPSMAIANEVALKFKETCQIHAEAYSSAEVLHGPVSIVEEGFPVISFAANDAAEQATADAADALAEKGAAVFATTTKVSRAQALPVVRTDHWITDPITAITSFYSMVEAVASARGIDPDAPRHLKKVTETV